VVAVPLAVTVERQLGQHLKDVVLAAHAYGQPIAHALRKAKSQCERGPRAEGRNVRGMIWNARHSYAGKGDPILSGGQYEGLVVGRGSLVGE
jgi:hypothetical protein